VSPVAKAGWKLIWQDEFNGQAVDSAKWNILLREQSKHNELQYYVPDEVYIENGCLRIRSRVRDFGTKHYTSGRLDTKDKFAPVYGRFEIRAKLPAGRDSGRRTGFIRRPRLAHGTSDGRCRRKSWSA
jgi:beta-glucanase (GH16 family)